MHDTATTATATFNYHNNLTWDNLDDATSSHPSTPAHVPSVLDCVFQDIHEAGPGGLSLEQTSELRTLSAQTSNRLKNLYCNAVGLQGFSFAEVTGSATSPSSSSVREMRKTSVANRDEEFFHDVDSAGGGTGSGGGSGGGVARPLSPSPSQWTTFHDQDGISVSEFSHSDYPMDTLMASCHVEVRLTS